MITRQRDYDDLAFDREPRSSRGGASGTVLTSAILAAAVGAGVALLLAPESGNKTRKRIRKRFGDLNLGRRGQAVKSKLLEEATSRLDDLTDRWEDLQEQVETRLVGPRRSGSREVTIGAIGTLVGAGVALLLAPESGAETRERITQKFRHYRGDLSTRWQPHRPSGSGATGGGPEEGAPSNGDADRAGRTPVRSLQELGREADEVGY
jgi:gas vesicle protein